MIGQGCPHLRRQNLARGGCATRSRWPSASCFGAIAILTLGTTLPLQAADLNLRLRVAWGGAERTTWSGSIAVDRGELTQLVPLGIESDEPGSIWLDQNVVHIQQTTRRDYGGVDISVTAPEDARLIIRLQSGLAQNEVVTETELGKLVTSEHRTAVDSTGNYVLVSRAPGDRFRVRVDREHLVYSPGEVITLTLEPAPELLSNQDTLELVAELARTPGGEALHSQKSLVRYDELIGGNLRVGLPAPREEGVYEVRLVLQRTASISRFVPTAGATVVLERRIQFVVINPATSGLPPSIQWEEVASMDLANQNWMARIPSRLPSWSQLHKLPGMPQRPLSNVAHAISEIAGKPALVLPRPVLLGEKAWHAVPVAVERPNAPYLLTIDFPDDRVSQLGLSILEPNAAGYVYPVSRDYGVYSTGLAAGTAGSWTTKQFLFWPKTASPMVLLTNEHPDEPVYVGMLRLYRARTSDTSFVESLPSANHRIAAVQIDRPWIVESLGAREALDAANNQSVDDWQSFYDAATRLSDYVQLAGYNAAVLSAFADGSTIYPSELLLSTPRYDTGVLSSTAQDPLRKDFLELLLRTFDRAGLYLYVSLEFSTPLPELEQRRRAEDPQRTGIEWVGADGHTWAARNRPTGGAYPRYNLLNERVQDAILRVVREVVTRYGSHVSLRGVALQLVGNGYGQLMEPHWGFDDDTVARFTQDTGIEVPGSGPGRFAMREAFLLEQKRKEWIAWRAQVATSFYEQLAEETRAGNESRELLLMPDRLLERSEIRGQLTPSLAAPASLTLMLLDLGIQAEALAKTEGIVLLRPTFATPLAPLGAFAAEHQVNASSELDAILSRAAVVGDAVYFPNLTKNRRILSFDQLHPFGENKSFTLPLTQMRPLGNLRRRPLARALASRDATIFVEGGPTLVTELDEELRRGLEIFRKLPSGDCKKTIDRRQQPITVRTYHTQTDSFVCIANESPWPQAVHVLLEAPPGTQLLEIGTSSAPLTVPMDPPRIVWNVPLAGYGVHAARISAPSARVTSVDLKSSSTMKTELTRRIDDLSRRALHVKKDQPLLAIRNSGFEQAGDRDGSEIAGWHVSNPQGGRVEPDLVQPQEGNRSLRITSLGSSLSVASDTFAPPAAGRLAVSAFMRRSPQSPDVAVMMIVEDVQGTLRRAGRIGHPNGPALREGWAEGPYQFRVESIPVDGQTQLRVRFEVVGEGIVWIDNVQVTDESLGEQQRELAKLIYEAQLALKREAYSECLESLESFWPRYLAAHVPIPLGQDTAAAAPTEPAPAAEPPAREKGVADRLKGLVPRIWQ